MVISSSDDGRERPQRPPERIRANQPAERTLPMKTTTTPINGIDTGALQGLMDQVQADHSTGIARFSVTSTWVGGTRTDTRVQGWELGGRKLPKDFTISIDEPHELLGTNEHANPQEYLMAAMNACIMATYVAACSVNGIELEHLEIETQGELDLRGFLALSASVKPGYDRIDFTVRIKGNGTSEQFQQIHDFVQRTSPNFYNLANAVTLNPTLVVE
jgi:uncharacterized OsmC-like protein